MSTNKRGHNEGSIDERGKDRWRIRYRIGNKRHTTTVQGTLTDARRALRAKLKAGDDGVHVAPDRITFAQWKEAWVALLRRQSVGEDDSQGADAAKSATQRKGKRKRGLVNARTLERYEELLRLHVVPTLGDTRLQRLTANDFDTLYVKLEKTLSVRTVHHVHTVVGSCLNAAVRKGLLVANPTLKAEAPSPDDADAATVLEREQLTTLMHGFRKSVLYPIVAVAAFTGARRNEILALRWSDFNAANKTLTIARSLEETKAHGVRYKEPKTDRGIRTITIDDGLIELLTAHRETHLRIAVGVPDGIDVDLSLVKLPDDALIFPSSEAPFDFARPRDARSVSKEFMRKAKRLGFPIRFHDLRATHETLLLDAGVPVHVVAARCGHDPAVLLRVYAKRTKKADTSAAEVIGALSKGALGG